MRAVVDVDLHLERRAREVEALVVEQERAAVHRHEVLAVDEADLLVGAVAVGMARQDRLVVRQARDELARLADVLGRPRAPDTVHIPWQGWSLTTEDFVVTRCMEMVVHGDDHAASIDVPTPEFPDPVVERVLALLTGVAVRRHGQAAVVRALSRPQRAPAHVSAF
jgi:hypothetical protein